MPRPRSDIRERILEVALDAFLEKGVDGASLREVARRAGTNIGMIYYYFPSKEELFFGVVEETYALLLERMREALDPARAFETRLLGLFLFIRSVTPEEGRVVQLVLREVLASHERMDALLERFKRGHLPLLIELVGQGFREGRISRAHNPFVALACLAGIGLLPQLLPRLVAGHLPALAAEVPDAENLPAQLRDIYLRALAAPDDDVGKERP